MSPKALRTLGLLLLLAAVGVAILNLKRIADLGIIWLAPILLITGIGLIAASRRRG